MAVKIDVSAVSECHCDLRMKNECVSESNQVTAYKYGLQYGVTAYLTNTVKHSICPADVLMLCLRAHECIVRVKGLELLTESIHN